jgi:hypothetical protein
VAGFCECDPYYSEDAGDTFLWNFGSPLERIYDVTAMMTTIDGSEYSVKTSDLLTSLSYY